MVEIKVVVNLVLTNVNIDSYKNLMKSLVNQFQFFIDQFHLTFNSQIQGLFFLLNNQKQPPEVFFKRSCS